MKCIYLPPLFDERKCSARFSYLLMKEFSRRRQRLERCDYRGTGEAEGEFCDVTLESLGNDVGRLLSGSVCLSGLRAGATLALDYCMNHGGIENLILVEPIIDGKDYVNHLLRKQRVKNMLTGGKDIFSDDGYINLEGYRTNSKLIEQFRQFDLMDRPVKNKPAEKIFLIAVSKQHDVKFLELSRRLREAGSQVVAKRFCRKPFWERIADVDMSDVINEIGEFADD